MRILSAASEVFPLVKTGGLADVTGALPGALKRHGIETVTFVPGYPAVMATLSSAEKIHEYADFLGGKAHLLRGRTSALDLLVLDAPHLYNRPGNIYLGPDGKDWPDNARRYAAFSRVAADVAMGRLGLKRFDILHLHDWQAALAAAYMRYDPSSAHDRPATVFTIHNIAFQGSFSGTVFPELGLPASAFAIDGLEYFGNVNFMKGGITSASRITTVSPTYAQEITTPDFGMGLDGLLRERRNVLSGIVNGIDDGVWNPATDTSLAKTYGPRSLANRAANKRELEKRLGLERDDSILHGVVSRLTWQKGLDLLAGHLDWLVASGARLALVGTGEPAIEQAFREAAIRHKGRVGAAFAYDEGLSHLVQAGADTMLVPSRFEPCGLTQLYGLRYGCVPIVARTGGLADTVIDANVAALSVGVATGIQFSPINADALQAALARAHSLFENKQQWNAMQKRGMSQDVSWTASAAAYAQLFRSMSAK
jgi:starch synthase